MRIGVPGPLEVQRDDGGPLTVPGAKERLLLATLTAGAPGAVSFDALAESLWGRDPPATARTSLQIHIVRLRSSLEPHRPRGSTGRFVARRGPGYALTVPRDAVDALRIDDLAARERAAAGRPEAELYRAARLGAALDWAAGSDADLTPVEQEFLDASQETAQTELTAARRRADREAAARAAASPRLLLICTISSVYGRTG